MTYLIGKGWEDEWVVEGGLYCVQCYISEYEYWLHQYDRVANVQFIKCDVYDEALPISLHIIEYLMPKTVTMLSFCSIDYADLVNRFM